MNDTKPTIRELRERDKMYGVKLGRAGLSDAQIIVLQAIERSNNEYIGVAAKADTSDARREYAQSLKNEAIATARANGWKLETNVPRHWILTDGKGVNLLSR